MENLRIILWAAFAMLLYATYAQWSYEPTEQRTTAQEVSPENPRTNMPPADTNKPYSDGVLGLSDTIPAISANTPAPSLTASPTLVTDVLRNNVLETVSYTHLTLPTILLV